MRNISWALVLLFMVVVPNILTAQNRIGHLNLEEVMLAHPDYKVISDTLIASRKQLEDQYWSLQEEYNALIKPYEELIDHHPSNPPEDNSEAIKQLEADMAIVQSSAEWYLEFLQEELMAPLETKIMEAINLIAMERGYNYVFDSSDETLLLAPESEDITLLVKQKLGIAP